jgi:hypothetical protein
MVTRRVERLIAIQAASKPTQERLVAAVVVLDGLRQLVAR